MKLTARENNQKLKLLYLSKIFMELTDDAHGITISEIVHHLNERGIKANRKTLYMDIEELRHFGLDIISEPVGKTVIYYLGSRDFELPELKLLVDSVQSAKFITEKKSRALIKKLENLVSTYEAKQLHRQVIITGRIKSMNESIYYNVDIIHSAINSDSQIRFQYFRWNVKKQAELRHNGEYYCISPWYLIYDNEYYYLIGYEGATGMIKHYRVDKMLHTSETNIKREGKEELAALDVAAYSRHVFGMFGGEETRVILEVENSKAGIIIDRFGKDTSMIPKNDKYFTAFIDVIPSEHFLGWIIGLGTGVKIVAPDSVVKKMKDTAKRVAEQYLSE